MARVQRASRREVLERIHQENGLQMKRMQTVPQLIGDARRNRRLTTQQAASLLRHRRGHTEGHVLFMIRLMLERGMSFKDAHERAMKAVGR